MIQTKKYWKKAKQIGLISLNEFQFYSLFKIDLNWNPIISDSKKDDKKKKKGK